MSKTVDQIVVETGADRCLVSFLFQLSTPLRVALRAMLSSVEGWLVAEEGLLVGKATQFDVVNQMLTQVKVGMEVALEPVNRFFQTFPIDIAVRECPTAERLFSVISEQVGTTVPVTAFTNFLGIGGLDLFEGINSYVTLKRKVEELAFRIQRATALSDYANLAKSKLEENLRFVRQYIAVLDDL